MSTDTTSRSSSVIAAHLALRERRYLFRQDRRAPTLERKHRERVRLDAQLDHVTERPAAPDRAERRDHTDAVDVDPDLRAAPAGRDPGHHALRHAGAVDDERALRQSDRRV